MHFRDGQTIFDGFAGENGLAATVTWRGAIRSKFQS